MVNKSGRLGSSWEIDLMKGLREEGFDVERLRTTGARDEGDLVIRDGHTIIVEAKNEKSIDLPRYLRELSEEVVNYTNSRGLDPEAVEGVVLVKQRGKNWRKGYAVVSIEDYFDLKEKE